jgi:hypothetical protein
MTPSAGRNDALRYDGQGPQWADFVEKLFAASANSQKAENCSLLTPLSLIAQVKSERFRILFCQI